MTTLRDRTLGRPDTDIQWSIHTQALTKHYGRTVGLEGLDLAVPRGVVFGYLGPNGAGKTTTIRLLTGLLRPTAGRAEVLGFDAVTDRDRVHQWVGYLPGQFVAYPDLTARRYLRYLAGLRGRVDWHLVEALAARLELELDRRVGELSHGNRQKVGLVQAFMHEPELLILDEPTIGLDPLAQRVFLEMLREARAAGRTVFLSSHILAEVEAIADMVAILRAGRLVVVDRVESLKARAVHRLDLTFAGPPPVPVLRSAEGVRGVEASNATAHITLEGSAADLMRLAAPYQIERIQTFEEDLEEVFLSYYTRA